MFSSWEDGGVAIPNIVIQDMAVMALKIAWINRLHSHPQSTWAQLAFILILTSNICSTNKFWKYVLLAWAELNYNDNPLDVKADTQQIWYNTHVMVQRKAIFIHSWHKAGIRCIGDLKDQNGNFFVLQ